MWRGRANDAAEYERAPSGIRVLHRGELRPRRTNSVPVPEAVKQWRPGGTRAWVAAAGPGLPARGSLDRRGRGPDHL